MLTFLLLLLYLTAQQPIADIEVRGNTRVPEETILHHVGALEGEPPSSDAIGDAFRRLWETGLFEDIRFEIEGDRLVVIVEEKPLLGSVRFTGESVPEEEIREGLRRAGFELLTHRPFGNVDARRVETLIEGFLGERFQVSARLEPAAEGRRDLVIHVEREPLPRIRRITFEGNRVLEDEELREAMELESSDWLSWLTRRDRLTSERLEEDLERIRSLYRSLGYALARVGPAEVEPVGEKHVSVAIPIYEGERYRFGGIEIDPGSLLTEDTVREWLPPLEEYFDATAIDRVSERIENYYRARGYPAVEVEREEVVSSEPDRVFVALRVREGPFYRVGHIEFRGNERHRDRDLRQYVDLEESERFDQREIEAGVRSLMSLGNFRSVTPEVDLASRAGRADVIYHVDEIPPFEWLVGGGLNGTEGGTGSGQLLARSLLGRGEVFRIELDFGNRFQNVAAGYRDPSTLGHRLFFAVDFERFDLAFPDETSEDTYRLALRVGGPLGRPWQFLAGLSLARFTLESDLESEVAFLTPFLGERFRTNRAIAAVAFEGRDRPLYPTRGLASRLGIELSGSALGGDVDVVAVRSQATLILPIGAGARHLLAFAARAEAVWPFGQTELEGLPRFERLFLGGENDLRGFDVRAVGPRNGGVVVGGDRLVFASAEYQFVASSRLRLVGFFDLGNVYASDFDGIELPELRYDAGGEAQIRVPVANVPLRLGYGVNLDRVGDEPTGRFYLALAVRF